MAWNEPGGNRDPWGQGGRRGGGGGAPDLDEMLERLKARFRGGKGGGGGGPRPGGLSSGGTGLVALLIGLLWLASGFYIVDEQERAVVLRFGAYSAISTPGLRWHLPWPMERVIKVNVTQVRQVSERAEMLTQDENIVRLDLKVQYRVNSAQNYLFSLQEPDRTLREVTKSAVREVVGTSNMDFILTDGRVAVANRIQEILQDRLDKYESGLMVSEVNLEDAQPPEPVQGAFADAIKAREDQQRLKNEAEAYANDRLPRARGAAARELAESIGYRDRLVAEAEGESVRFTRLLAEYRKAPRVTRDRLYLETMSEVLTNTPKVMVDINKGGPLIYLPLDQLARGKRANEPAVEPAPTTSGTRQGTTPGTDFRSRDRGGR
jgi:modulator of FtsH protease HflK